MNDQQLFAEACDRFEMATEAFMRGDLIEWRVQWLAHKAVAAAHNVAIGKTPREVEE